MNEEDLSGKLRHMLDFFGSSRKLHIPNEDGIMVKTFVRQAPEPEDVLWHNLGRSHCRLFKKKLLTFLITIFVLGISFGVVYGLASLQVSLDNQGGYEHHQYLSFLISLAVSIFNTIIQRNYFLKCRTVKIPNNDGKRLHKYTPAGEPWSQSCLRFINKFDPNSYPLRSISKKKYLWC